MKLNDRRGLADYQENHWPAMQAQIQAAAGFEVPITVDWESIAADGCGESYADDFPPIYFFPIVEAFKKIGFDKMGKDALKSGIKQIIVQNKKPDYSSYWASLEDGVLTLDYQYTNMSNMNDRIDVLVDVLEEKL
jgi:hypothetical protein